MNTLLWLFLGLILIYVVCEIAKMVFWILLFMLFIYCLLSSFNGNITLHQIVNYIKTIKLSTIKQKIVNFFRGEKQ